MSEELKPLFSLTGLVATVDAWAKRHRIKRQATDDVGIALERICDVYEIERRQLLVRIVELEAQLILVSRELTSTNKADHYYRGFNDGFDHAKTQEGVK